MAWLRSPGRTRGRSGTFASSTSVIAMRPTSKRCCACRSCWPMASRLVWAKRWSSLASSTPKYRTTTRSMSSWVLHHEINLLPSPPSFSLARAGWCGPCGRGDWVASSERERLEYVSELRVSRVPHVVPSSDSSGRRAAGRHARTKPGLARWLPIRGWHRAFGRRGPELRILSPPRARYAPARDRGACAEAVVTGVAPTSAAVASESMDGMPNRLFMPRPPCSEFEMVWDASRRRGAAGRSRTGSPSPSPAAPVRVTSQCFHRGRFAYHDEQSPARLELADERCRRAGAANR